MKECVNCGNSTDTQFCANCGQKIEVQRVSLRGIMQEFLSKWIGFDTKFGRTIIDMVKDPGYVINTYLHGNRTRHIGPLGFLVVMTALLIISFDLFGIEVEDFLKENQSNIESLYDQQISENQLAFQQKVQEFVARNFRFFSTILIPFWGVGLWFFYRKANHNYMERIVVATFLTCQGIWLTILSLAVFSLTGTLYSIPLLIISILYYSYGLMKIHKTKNYFLSLLKTVGSYAVSSLIMLLVIFVIGFVIAILYFAANPELLQQQG